jgi:hypothetical protein
MPESGAIGASIARVTAEEFRARGGLVTVPGFLDDARVQPLVGEADALRARINRNYVPGVKQGGSVSYFDIRSSAPAIHTLYHSRELITWLSDATGETLQTCPESDPHACALYYYERAGDYIGWHYDTSFYRGKRFTVLIGLVQRSKSELVCRLVAGPGSPRELRVLTHPGTLVVFDDKLHHCVTPNGEGEYRVVLSLEYVTDRTMGFLPRIVSTVKDAVAYFGIRALLRPRR